MSAHVETRSNPAKVFRVAPSIAIVGVGLNARAQFRQFARGCSYMDLPKPVVTLFPNISHCHSEAQEWMSIINEISTLAQRANVIKERISSILPVGACANHHAHFVVETTTGTYSFDDLIMDGMPSLSRTGA